MKQRCAPSCTAVAVLLLSLLTAARSADAAIFTIEFTGTVHTIANNTVFGQLGSALPVNVSFTYDTSLGSQLFFVPAGSMTGSTKVAVDFYGYSATGVTATNVTFGTKTWTADDLIGLNLAAGSPATAALWFDKDPTVTTPTAVIASFRDADGRFSLGGVTLGDGISFASITSIRQTGVTLPASGNGTFSSTSSPSAVPEPASLLFVGTGLLGLAARARRSRR